jgi:hypothetical protein
MQDDGSRDATAPQGDYPEHTPAHNSAPDGRTGDDEADAGPGSTGGAIQGDSDRGESTGGAIQGDAGPSRDAPLGGDDTTADQLDADNPVEKDSLKTLDPDDPPA